MRTYSMQDRLGDLKPVYFVPRDDVADLVISPAMTVADQVCIMMGFFSSGSFSEIAPGLANFLNRSDMPLRLIISPFVSAEDQIALANGTLAAEKITEEAFEEAMPNADALARHTLQCLAWLISAGRLSVQIALMRDALFHPKVWLFDKEGQSAALHGSANMTASGLRKNREQLKLERSWKSEDSKETCLELKSEFEALWSGADPECRVIPLGNAIEQKILKEFKTDRQPSEKDFNRLWRLANGLPEKETDATELLESEKSRRFQIPEWLNYRDGDFAHQGRAIDAWMGKECRGILEMCTGSGKTLTALTAAKLLHGKLGRLLIVVSAPYNVLVEQWCEEIKQFGIRPTNMSQAGGPAGRSRQISSVKRLLTQRASNAEAIVVSNDTLNNKDFLEQIERIDCPKMLIADECHNLGTEAFISQPPDFFEYRLGLSATPVRQYDDDGTAGLFNFFGDPCFSFTLENAIGVCLTPYDYHVSFVELTANEMDEWSAVSQKISQVAWKMDAGDVDEYLQALLLKRRRILETAEAKVGKLRELLTELGPKRLRYSLIYATDKDPDQLQDVNSVLNSLGVFFHQLTAHETSNPSVSKKILESFREGRLQVLTAKRVLDEGVNVPQIMRAYILASTTVRRQWVQRRGRLLRTCKEIGKEYAVIHDLVALPPNSRDASSLDADSKKIIDGELNRVWEFARLSRNGAETGGPFEAVEAMRRMLGD